MTKAISSTIGGIGLALALMCLFADSFYTGSNITAPGFGSSAAKIYGLSSVSFKETASYSELSDRFCKYQAEKIIAGICESPLCKWYELKCNTYHTLTLKMVCSYAMYLMGIVCAIGGVIYYSLGRLPHIGKGAGLSLLGAALIAAGTCFGYYSVNTATNTLNAMSIYPPPAPAIGMMMSYGAAVLLTCSAGIAMCWRKQLKMIEDARDEAWDAEEEFTA